MQGRGVCGESETLVSIHYVDRNAPPHTWPGEKNAGHPPAKNRGQYVYVVIQKPWGEDGALPLAERVVGGCCVTAPPKRIPPQIRQYDLRSSSLPFKK